MKLTNDDRAKLAKACGGNLEEQRAIVATGIMKWKQSDDNFYPTRYFEPVNSGWLSKIEVADYHPDLEDNESLGQRERLKAVLRALGYWYKLSWLKMRKYHQAKIGHKYNVYKSESKLSEGAALLEAASKLAKEMGW